MSIQAPNLLSQIADLRHRQSKLAARQEELATLNETVADLRDRRSTLEEVANAALDDISTDAGVVLTALAHWTHAARAAADADAEIDRLTSVINRLTTECSTLKSVIRRGA